MEYQNIHQRVEHHSETGTQNTLQTLVVVASVLAFAIPHYYEEAFEIFVNISILLILPIVALSLVCSILSINIKISAYGEYLITVEKRINYILCYSNAPNAEANEKIVDWERWRSNYGVAHDKLVFYDGVILYAVIVLGSFILAILRLMYLSNILSRHLRLWVCVTPALFVLSLIVIFALFKKLKAHLFSNEQLLGIAEITYEKPLNETKGKDSGLFRKNLGLFALFIILYFGMEVILLMSFHFSFYSNEHKADFLVNQIITHRGLCDDSAPENTLAAFDNSILHGYTIELDIRFSRDGVPVVIHDKDLLRLCRIHEKINDLSIDEIKSLKVMEVEPIPTLQESLELINGQVPVIVDIKDYFPSTKNMQIVADLLDLFGNPSRGVLKVVNSANQRGAKGESFSFVSVAIREDVKPLDIAVDMLRSCIHNRFSRVWK